MAMIGAVNIFYAMYGLIQRNWVNMLIPTVTYLILMYSSALMDEKTKKIRRSNS